MRPLILLLFLLLSSPLARAQATDQEPGYLLLPPSEISRIHGVISSQVEAFRAGDLETAFSFAAPRIRQVFGTPQVFGQMVEQGYGQIFSTLDFEFVELVGTVQSPVQVVAFTGTDLTTILAFYFMELQPEGVWRIGGVQIAAAEEQAI